MQNLRLSPYKPFCKQKGLSSRTARQPAAGSGYRDVPKKKGCGYRRGSPLRKVRLTARSLTHPRVSPARRPGLAYEAGSPARKSSGARAGRDEHPRAGSLARPEPRAIGTEKTCIIQHNELL